METNVKRHWLLYIVCPNVMMLEVHFRSSLDLIFVYECIMAYLFSTPVELYRLKWHSVVINGL